METEIKDDLLEKYFLDTKTKQTKDRICETSEDILSIYQDGENMRKFNEEYGKNINNFIENRIVDLTLLFTNFLINECDIQKIFNSVKLDENVVFSKISMRRKKHYFKIFKPMLEMKPLFLKNSLVVGEILNLLQKKRKNLIPMLL